MMKSIVAFGIALFSVSAIHAAEPAYTIQQLRQMSWAELEQLYRQLSPGKIPCGYIDGKAIYCSKCRSNSANMVWKGKHFCDGVMLNQWAAGYVGVAGRVYVGESWMDGKPSIMLDYRGRHGIWSDARDEFRQVCPGVYLGLMYRDRCKGPKIEAFFVLGCD